MRAIYVRRATLGSWVLRTGMWSSWSHCGIVTPDDTVMEAAAFHGVREIPLSEFLSRASAYSMKDIPVPDDAAAIAWAREQVGKPYDWLGAIGLALHREWDSPDKWFCSEFVEGAAKAGGRQRFINQARRVTPQHSWMVA